MADSHAIEYVYALIDKYSPVINNMAKNTHGFSKSTESSLGKALKSMRLFGINVSSILSAQGIIEITKKIINFSKESVKAFEEQEIANVMVNKTLDITKNKVGKTFQELKDSASALQSTTFFGDEAIMTGATTQLLRFTSITGKEFDRIQKLTLDVSAGMQGTNASQQTLSNSARMLGMAYEDPIKGMRLLRSMNIIMTDSETKMITAMVNNGDVLKAREYIIGKIESKYKGMAEELANTSAGMNLQTKNMIGDMQEVIGEGLVPLRMEFQKGLIQTLKEVTPLIVAFSKGLTYFFQNDWKYFADVLSEIKGLLFDIFKGFFSSIQDLLPGLRQLMKLLLTLAKNILAEIRKELNFVWPVFKFVAGILKDWIDIFNVLIEMISPFIPILIRFIVISAVISNIFIILSFVTAKFVAALVKLFVLIIKFVATLKIWGKIWDWIKDKFDKFGKTKIGEFIFKTFDKIKKGITDFNEWIKNSPLGKTLEVIFHPFKSLDKLSKFFEKKIEENKMPVTPELPKGSFINQNVNVKTGLDITVKADKNTAITKFKRDDNLGRQRRSYGKD